MKVKTEETHGELPKDEVTVININWKAIIEQARTHHSGYDRVCFYDSIWEMSTTAFDIPREVQVIIDANDNSFISVGTPGFVSFMGQEKELYGQTTLDNEKVKMTFPLKEWIHTHPFGKAYFSGTDLRTCAIYRNHMLRATVLGDGERMTMMFGVGCNGEDYQEYVQHTFIGDEEE